MRHKSLIMAVVVAAILIAAGIALRGDAGREFHRWLASLHGTGAR